VQEYVSAHVAGPAANCLHGRLQLLSRAVEARHPVQELILILEIQLEFPATTVCFYVWRHPSPAVAQSAEMVPKTGATAYRTASDRM
jgi:hypothetical protein